MNVQRRGSGSGMHWVKSGGELGVHGLGTKRYKIPWVVQLLCFALNLNEGKSI